MEEKVIVNSKTRISEIFRNARTIAILTVIAAHITIRDAKWLSNLYSAIGSIGVIAFFLISGYYYKRESFATLCKKKLKNIIIPWLVLGVVVYVGNSLLSASQLSLLELIKWLLGYKTYLYFVPVLLCCFVVFYYNNLILIIFAILLNVLSIILTATGILPPLLSHVFITNYLNIFNWIGFFAIGLLLKKLDVDKLYSFIKNTRFVCIVISCASTIGLSLVGYEVGYFSALGWLYELIATLSIFGLCSFEFMNNRFVVSISELSYPIYLLHMLFVGVLGKIYNLHISLLIVSNLIVLLVVWALLLLGLYLSRKIKLEKIYKICLGIRTN